MLLAISWGCGASQDVESAPPATCDIDRAARCVAHRLNEKPCLGEPIQVGTHCDDIYICTDEIQAQAIMDRASAFTCAPGAGEPALCEGSAWTCQWVAPGSIDDAELDAICAVTVLPTPPANVACVVFI